jgi:hypothetical protein
MFLLISATSACFAVYVFKHPLREGYAKGEEAAADTRDVPYPIRIP